MIIRMKKISWAHVAMLTATLLYGANYRIAKLVMPVPMDPVGFVMVRLLGALLFFHLIHRLFIREKVLWKDILYLFGCGAFGACINMVFFFKGLAITSPVDSAIIMVTAPIMVLTISFIARIEKLDPVKLLGLLIGFGGAVLLLSSDGDVAFSQDNFLGNIMVLINALAYAIYLVMARSILKRYHPITAAKWIFTGGFLCAFPFFGGKLLEIPWGSFSTLQWSSVFFVVIGATVLTYLLNLTALRRVPPSVVGYYVYVQPVFATFLDIILGYAVPDQGKILAAILIFVGVYLVREKPEIILKETQWFF